MNYKAYDENKISEPPSKKAERNKGEVKKSVLKLLQPTSGIAQISNK